MNKRGFTLVELLAVIVILGIIAVITVPNAITMLSNSGTKIYSAKEDVMVSAAKDYVISNKDFVMPTESVPSKYLTINTLVSANFMSKILDNTSGNECIGFVKITIDATYGYDYESCLLCDNYTTNKTFCTSSTYNEI